MGKKLFSLIIGFILLLSCQPTLMSYAQPKVPEDARIAFVRQHNLWLRDVNGERRVSQLDVTSKPRWSADGKFVAVVGDQQVSNHIVGSKATFTCLEVINADTSVKQQVVRYHTPATITFDWSPKGHKLAFSHENHLNVADFDKDDIRHGIAHGVSDFVWLPDASGFILATSAHLLPDGWTNVLLYKLQLGTKNGLMSGNSQVTPKVFYRLPKVLKDKGDDLMVTSAHDLKWSKDGRWLAFIASPTASLSMDENRLCVLSKDAAKFQVVGTMLRNPEWFKWSPGASTLGFIRGSGRDSTRGKKLTLAVAPRFASRNLAPMGAVDDGFCWMDAAHVIVSRHQEALPSRSPIQLGSSLFPVLFNIDVERPTIQNRITSPPDGVGDYNPVVLGWQQVLWKRAAGDNQKGEIWFGKADGTEIRLWLEGVSASQFEVYSGQGSPRR